MTPGYGFAYFRWRSFGLLRQDESEDCLYVRCWRKMDFQDFAGMQANP